MGASPPTIERIDRAVRIVELDDGTRWRIHPKARKAIAQWKVGDEAETASFPMMDYTHLITNKDVPSKSVQARPVDES